MTKKIEKNDFKKAQPFIKWVGGKRGLLSQIIPLLPKEFNNYFEPFVGGGALFFELYSSGLLKDKKIYLFDINTELINTYNIVKNKPDSLIRELEKFKEKHSKEFYLKVRAWDREEGFLNKGDLLRATRFIYLNKTCFNGLWRVNKKSQHNVPMGNYKNPKICDSEAIYNASEALQNAIVMNTSYKDVLKYTTENDFVYFDPPYYPLEGSPSFTSYSEFDFMDKQQEELFSVFNELNKAHCKVAHSNSDTKFIENLYILNNSNKKYNIEKIQANRFINSKSNGRGKISEAFIRNFE